MGTQDAPLSSYIGTFQNTKEVIINGGHFAINPHDTINRESNTDSMNIKKLYEHISTAALHTSQERAEEVPETEWKNIANEWSSRLRTLSTTTPTESPLPFSSTFDRLSTDAALYDIFNWLYDPFTSSSVVWMHGSGNTRTQALLLANALAHILHQHRLLSASYFFSASTDNASVVPTIAYQLAQNITQAKVPIARAVDRNLAVFTSRCHDQVEQLIVNPLRKASSDLCNEFFEAPKVIIIYGLEDYSDKNNFQTSFLDSLTRAVVELEVTHFPQKLLVLGQHTDRLQECFLQLKIVQRPIQVHNLLEKEHEICRKEKEIEKQDKALAIKEKSINARVETLRRELRSQAAHLNETEEKVKQRGKELEDREGALRCREEEVVSQEQELKKRQAEMEDTARRREEALGLRERAVTEREGASQGREEKIANQEQHLKKKWEDMKDREGALGLRELAAAKREGACEDKVANQEQDLKKKWDGMGDTTRRRAEPLGLQEQAIAEREGAASLPFQTEPVRNSLTEELPPVLEEPPSFPNELREGPELTIKSESRQMQLANNPTVEGLNPSPHLCASSVSGIESMPTFETTLPQPSSPVTELDLDILGLVAPAIPDAEIRQIMPSSSIAPSPEDQPPDSIPVIFHPLFHSLELHHQKGISQPLRSVVGSELAKEENLYQRAGVRSFKKYIALAEERGIVTCGGIGGHEWVSFKPSWENVVVDSVEA